MTIDAAIVQINMVCGIMIFARKFGVSWQDHYAQSLWVLLERNSLDRNYNARAMFCVPFEMAH